MSSKIYNVLIGGKAGEGVKKAAQVIADLAVKHGQYIFQTDDYQSLIRGGHNFSLLSISDERTYNTYAKADLIVSFDQRSILRHLEDMAEGALHFCNEGDSEDARVIPLPLSALMKEHYQGPAHISLSAVAIFAALCGISLSALQEIIKAEFRRQVDENIAYAAAIYALIKERYPQGQRSLAANPDLPAKNYTGNQAIALGAYAGGLDYYYGYPMTPASSILHYLAKMRDTHGVYAIHAESELAAINMAIGSAFAGRRSAVGSSGGGFALMQEGFSLAGMVEAPLLCILSSRPGPATGASTYTGQEDLYFALNQGHGEFARIVASPDSFERAFSLAAELLDLAWECQSPAILLTEKQLSESMINLDLPVDDLHPPLSEEAKYTEPYERYALTESGISPLKFPGAGNCAEDDIIKWNSNEHVESGVRTDTAFTIVAMRDKRNRKYESIVKATQKYQRIARYGQGEKLVFAYGSTALELREAQKYLPFRLVVPIYLEPFPFEELSEYQGAEAIVVEHASHPNFARFLKEKLNVKIKTNILRYDGRHFHTEELIQKLKEAFDA
ncbi:MAG: 2-oxoacid:acceptor oxidoreductase family protein [Candidatus Cloacimonetes bacterium]|nr:2-oxoacid:acceptor oxidoreductase family protein [Candidatus Cloacimonadota bacterium]MCK9185209.1 2-oxoacid:acceptor oxidoreductase family protein [Candidatus Cloacimonadota bacterium]MCK9583966.1 2-oxoacid:acceptor oxidoreductase family protein [Candidatus Cloacimonadota bacterium]